MMDSKSPSIVERWESRRNHITKQSEELQQDEKRDRQEKVNQELYNVLRDNNQRPGNLQTPKSLDVGQRAHCDDSKNSRERSLYTECQPAPLLTPPDSPIASKFAITIPVQSDEASRDDVEKYQREIDSLRRSITSLKLRLEGKEAECDCLREERQELLSQLRRAINNDAYEEVKKLQKRVKNLNELSKEQEEIIETLQTKVTESRKRERDLERCLADAERRIEEKDKQLKRSAQPAVEPPSNKRPIGQRPKNKDWGIYRRRGSGKSTFDMALDMCKRG